MLILSSTLKATPCLYGSNTVQPRCNLGASPMWIAQPPEIASLAKQPLPSSLCILPSALSLRPSPLPQSAPWHISAQRNTFARLTDLTATGADGSAPSPPLSAKPPVAPPSAARYGSTPSKRRRKPPARAIAPPYGGPWAPHTGAGTIYCPACNKHNRPRGHF